MKKFWLCLILIQSLSWLALAQEGGNGSDRGGGGGIACFHSKFEKDAFIEVRPNGKKVLKRVGIPYIEEFMLLDFFADQKGWASGGDLVLFANMIMLRSVHNIKVSFAEQFTLNEVGYRQRGPESFEQVKMQSEKFYLAGIDQALKLGYSPLLYKTLQDVRKKVPFEKWIDEGPIEDLQDFGSINMPIPPNCEYVQVAIRSKAADGTWQVVYDKKLVEQKFSAFMLSMLRIHEEVYLIGALLKNYQVDWSFYNSENVRSLTQTLFSAEFHNQVNGLRYCRQYIRFHQLIKKLGFVEGLEKLSTSKDKVGVPATDEACPRVFGISRF